MQVAPRSAKLGDIIRVTAKVENTAALDASVSLFAEGTPFPVVFEPAALAVVGKSRASVAFEWRAALPEGVDAKTLRGKLVLRATDSGQSCGEAGFDVYISSDRASPA